MTSFSCIECMWLQWLVQQATNLINLWQTKRVQRSSLDGSVEKTVFSNGVTIFECVAQYCDVKKNGVRKISTEK